MSLNKSIVAISLVLFLAIPSTYAASVGNNNSGTAAVSDSASGGGAGGNASFTDKSLSYTAPSLGAAKGTDTLQVGSPFGSLTISNDTLSADLRENVEVMMRLHKAGFLSDDEMFHFSHHTLAGLTEESKEDKCFFGMVKCGRRRKITNLFKLL